MTLPICTWNPLRASYSFQDAESDAYAVQHNGGAPAYRKGFDENSITMPVVWRLQGSDINAFFAFYVTDTGRGASPFEIDLILDDPFNVTTHKAYFLPDSMQIKWQSDDIMTVSATLEVKPNEYDVEAGLDMVGAYNEFGPGWRTAFLPVEDDFNTLVNVDIPAAFPPPDAWIREGDL